MTREQLLEELLIEAHAPPPKPWRNRRINYDLDIEAERAAARGRLERLRDDEEEH